MALHMTMVAELAQLFNELMANAVGGKPLRQSLDLVRRQFNARSAAIVVDSRVRSAETSYYFYAGEGDEIRAHTETTGMGNAGLLSSLTAGHWHASAHYTSADRADRYTLWLFRSHEQADFDAEESSLLDFVVAQLARSVELAWRMGVSEVERTLYSDVLERLKIGVIMLDVNGRVVRSSRIADRLTQDHEGLYIQGGKLRASSTREDKALQDAVKTALSGQGATDIEKSRGLSLTKRCGGKNLGVIVRRVEGSEQSGTGQTVAVYVRDSEVAQELEGDLVRQILDLTPAEAAVARRLTEGLSLDDAASSLAISRNTARAHLRSIFSKNGITRQTELVRMVLNSAAMLGQPSRPAA